MNTNTSMQHIIEKHGLRQHLYADDSQICGSLWITSPVDVQATITATTTNTVAV